MTTVCYHITSKASEKEREMEGHWWLFGARENEWKTAGVVAGDEIHNSMNNLQDNAPMLLGAEDYSRDTNELSLLPLLFPSHRGDGVIC